MHVPKIPSNQVIPHSQLSLQQKPHAKSNFLTSRSPSIETAILKYYPKYCFSLRLDRHPKPWPVLSRVKQIKTLSHLEYDFGDDYLKKKKTIIKCLKRLLQNKRKSFKSLPIIAYGFPQDPRIMEMCIFFSRIQTLEISGLKKQFSQSNSEKEIEKAYGHFWKLLTNVQSFKLTICTVYFEFLLQKINSSPKFLNTLKDFSVTIIFSQEIRQKYSPTALFQTFLENKELLKHITHLNFANFKEFHSCGSQVKSILDHCPKLTYLSYPIETEFSTFKPDEALAPLKSMQNVTILSLNVWDVWAMIQAFEFPVLLEKLTLQFFHQSGWHQVWFDLFEEELKEDQLKIKNEEKYQIWLNFFEKIKIKKLERLSSLCLNTPRFTQTNQFMHYFVLPLLKTLPKIENFECQLYQEYLKNNHPFDISVFFDEMSPFQTLKSLKLFQTTREKSYHFTKTDFIITFNPKKSLDLANFSQLKSLNIGSWVSQDFDFKNFFKMYAVPLKEISLQKIFITSMEIFVKLLSAFENIELSGLKINLGISLCVKSLTQIIQYLSSSIILPSNVSISLDIYLPSSKAMVLNQKGVEIMRNIFGKFKFNVYLLLKEDDSSWKRGQTKCKPVMKDNKQCVLIEESYFQVDPHGENYQHSLEEDDNRNDQEYFLQEENDDSKNFSSDIYKNKGNNEESGSKYNKFAFLFVLLVLFGGFLLYRSSYIDTFQN